MTDDLAAAQQLFNRVMASMGPQKRQQTTTAIARILRGDNAANIAAQKEASGAPFAPRKKRKAAPEVKRARKFLYPSGGSGPEREVLLKSYRKQGDTITGFDVEAEDIRSFKIDKIIRYLPVRPEEENKGAARPLRQRRSIKSGVMFRRLRTYSKLRAGSDAQEAWAGFNGAAGRIAEVHQTGGLDRATENAPLTRYEIRRLLGLSGKARDAITDLLLNIAKA